MIPDKFSSSTKWLRMLKPAFVNSWITNSLKRPKKDVHCLVWFPFKTDPLTTDHSKQTTFIIDPFLTGIIMFITDNLHNGSVIWAWCVMKWSVINAVCYEMVCYEMVCYERVCYKRGLFRVVRCEWPVSNGHCPAYSMLWKEREIWR